jgi:citrate synthase
MRDLSSPAPARVDAPPQAEGPWATGLDQVVVAATALSEVDGERGFLRIAGHDVERWALETTYERAGATLLALGGGGAVSGFAERLGRARQRAWETRSSLGDALDTADGMEALRGALARVRSSGVDLDDAIAVAGAAAVWLPAWLRQHRGLAPLAPDPSASCARDVVRMATGRDEPARAQALEAYLVTVMDHGMNASTFTARVVASTGADMISALVAGVCALKGPLHGGAPGPVLDMLDAIGAPERALSYLTAQLDAGHRIMGMGHRIYRVRDPRAAVLEEVARRLAASGEVSPRLALARAVEEAAARLLAERKPDRPLAANVEFYTAVVLDAVGLPASAFSATFALGRVLGWAAHVLEQRRVGRLIRPASRYVGPTAA